MNIAVLLQLVLKYGPSVISYVVKFGPDAVNVVHEIHSLIAAGKTTVDANDLAKLQDLASKSASDYLKDAGVSTP